MTLVISGNCVPKDTVKARLQADSALLSTAVAKASAIALHHFRNDARQWYKGPGQIVTEADIAVDRCLHEILIEARPGDGWLSEECADDGSRHSSQRVWIVDPIDGTRSFAEGVPEFTISIALIDQGKPVLASIMNPVTNEHFRAVAGGGATLNERPLSPSDHREIKDASLLASSGEMKKRRWPETIPAARFTTIGSLAYKLALVAAGRFDGLVSLRSCHDWDVAAAVLILQEAGCLLGDGSGNSLSLNEPTMRHDGLVAAGNECLYTNLVTQLDLIRLSSV